MLYNPCLLFADETKIYNHIMIEDNVCKLQQEIVKSENGPKRGRCLLMFPST